MFLLLSTKKVTLHSTTKILAAISRGRMAFWQKLLEDKNLKYLRIQIYIKYFPWLSSENYHDFISTPLSFFGTIIKWSGFMMWEFIHRHIKPHKSWIRDKGLSLTACDLCVEEIVTGYAFLRVGAKGNEGLPICASN